MISKVSVLSAQEKWVSTATAQDDKALLAVWLVLLSLSLLHRSGCP